MTLFPDHIDSDVELPRVDDNLTEIGGQAINALRDAAFSIEKTLGIDPQGSVDSIATRLGTSINPDGTIKASALTSVGLATLPIVDNQVAVNAGIKESKLSLDFSTSNLHTLILGNSSLINSLTTFTSTINSDLLSHISGSHFLNDGITFGRHVASQIDINDTPSDLRDNLFIWTGLLDRNGVKRTATTVAQALLQINNELVGHENASSNAHSASAISVDTSKFNEIPKSATDVQKVINSLDGIESTLFKSHRENLHANGISKTARFQSFKNPDGYSETIVPPTSVNFFLYHPPSTSPLDSTVNGDNIVTFNANNSGFVFDSQFNRVKVGDIIRINYGSGIEASFPIESIRFVPGSEWTVRIIAPNLIDGYGYARIDRSPFDTNTKGILAAAAVNQSIDNTILGSLIIADPKSANVLGLGFDAGKLDTLHYNLYLQIYPTGNPASHFVTLPAIDVTGNKGVTPGKYTLDSVVQTINDAFHSPGYNYRFIAYAYNGDIGIALADTVSGAGFAVVSGVINGSSLGIGSFVNNVVGDALDGIDPLGFGINAANVASPAYSATFSNSASALLATKIFLPSFNKKYDVNGIERDSFEQTISTIGDGYWPAQISARTVVGSSTVEVSYEIQLDLRQAGLSASKTIVVQPILSFSDPNYNDVDYGRFIIKNVNYNPCNCGPTGLKTTITVLNGVHALATPTGFTSPVGTFVKIYFSEDSVAFNANNVSDSGLNSTPYNRLHEIYVNENGKTFSHERARMPMQAGSSTLLDTTDNPSQKQWNLVNVSPKLRGFVDDSSVSLNRYVRFFVLNYNTASGEYDGYIGKRDLAGSISRTGSIITARKNVPTKFYDETNVDYIELEFTELNPTTPTVISSPRYVDIQIFPSLELNDEEFLLATCELKNNKVVKIRDARQFGTISEKNFTTSAIDFIRANDKEIQDNGIIRGFDFVGFSNDSTATRKILNYAGGVAAVNGSLVTVNNGSVEIPIVLVIGPLSSTWAICVNKFGQLQSVLITPNKSQLFLEKSNTDPSFYKDSMSFMELINNRKDLTLIDLATLSSAGIITRTDARKFISDEGLNSQLTWVGSSDLSEKSDIKGHFKTFEAVRNWINNYGKITNKIIVRGNFFVEPINNILNPADGYSNHIDLSNFTIPVVFESENATFYVSSNRCFQLGSNVTLRNFNFVYSPFLPSFSGLTVTLPDTGCLYAKSSLLKDITIDSCVFTTPSTFNSLRSPFININVSDDSVIDGLTIKNCKFIDSNPTARLNAAILVYNDGAGVSDPAILANCVIENNICNRDQGIYVTTLADDNLFVIGSGIAALNVSIKNNICGVIGHITTSTLLNNFANVRSGNRLTNLLIDGNTCRLISTLDAGGRYIYSNIGNSPTVPYGSGNVSIVNNVCNNISVLCQNFVVSSRAERSLVNISGNKLSAIKSTDNFGALLGANGTTAFFTAILVDGFPNTSDLQCYANVHGNSVDKGYYDTETSYYLSCFTSSSPVNVTNNTFNGIVGGASAILLIGNPGPNLTNISFSNNIISRGSNSIFAYINALGNLTGNITDNVFDSPTIDGSDYTNVVRNLSPALIIERNKNQTATQVIRATIGPGSVRGPGVGMFSIDTTFITSAVTPEITVTAPNPDRTKLYFINNTGATLSHGVDYIVDLQTVLPKNVSIVRIDSSCRSSQVLDVGNIVFNCNNAINFSVTTFADFATYTPPTTIPLAIVIADPSQFVVNSTFSPMMLIHTTIQNSGGPGHIEQDAITITYRW